MADGRYYGVAGACVVLLLCRLGASLAVAPNPGFKTRITSNGLNYAAKVGLEVLGQYITGVSLPDQHGSVSGFGYDITGMKVNGFKPPQGNIQVAPGSDVTWNANGGGLGIHGNFHYHALFISDGGTFDASVSGLNFNLGVILGEDSNGRPNISTRSCQCNIGNLNIEFHGGASAIYNLFSGLVADEIKGQIQSTICGEITSEINTDAEKALSGIPVEVLIVDMFSLDYRLVQVPQFTTKYMETAHKGEIYWKNSSKEAPGKCPVMPDASSTASMVYIWASDYLVDTLGYVAQTHSVLMYNLTENDLPPSSKGVLNTTCSGFACIGKFLPAIGKLYPNSKVELHMNSTRVPNMDIDTTGAILNGEADIALYARTPDTKLHYLATFDAIMAATVNMSVTNETLQGHVIDMDLKLKVKKSSIGTISDAALQFVTDAVLKIYIIPLLNQFGAKGFQLPVIQGVSFLNTKVTLAKDTVLIATDITYKMGTQSKLWKVKDSVKKVDTRLKYKPHVGQAKNMLPRLLKSFQ